MGEMAGLSPFHLEDSSLISREIILTVCIKTLAEAIAAAHAVCLSIIPGLIGSFGDGEPCNESETTSAEEYSPSVCKAHDGDDSGLVGYPNTSSRVMTQGVAAWIAVCKNKDDDDDDDDDVDEGDEDDEEDGDGEEDEEAGDEDEGEQGLEGGAGNEDDGGEDEDEDEDEDGKGEEDEEEEDGVEGEEEEDEDGVEDEDDEEDEDDDDEAPEPPQKKRK